MHIKPTTNSTIAIVATRLKMDDRVELAAHTYEHHLFERTAHKKRTPRIEHEEFVHLHCRLSWLLINYGL